MTKLLIYIVAISLFATVAYADTAELVPDGVNESEWDLAPTKATEWLVWDDGAHCGYYSGPGLYRATTFTAPYDLEILAARIFWYACDCPSHQVQMDIYDDNSGDPGSGLFASPVTITAPGAPGG